MTRLEVPAIYSSISRREPKRHRSCVEDGLVLAVIGRCALVALLGVGGDEPQPTMKSLMFVNKSRNLWCCRCWLLHLPHVHYVDVVIHTLETVSSVVVLLKLYPCRLDFPSRMKPWMLLVTMRTLFTLSLN